MKIKLRLSVGAMGLLLSGCLGVANSQTAAAVKSAKRMLAWDTASLFAVPKVHATGECPAPGMRGFFYEGADYKGKATWVFAYYAAPEGKVPAGGWPAVVCAHGGGGTAYPDWVKQWNDRGYAAVSMDLEGHLPDKRGHENAGPARRNWFSDIGLPDKEQWFYHAFADSIVKNSPPLPKFERPEINPKTGMVHTKWTGDITEAWMYLTKSSGAWKNRKWHFIQCRLGKGELVSVKPLPKGTTGFLVYGFRTTGGHRSNHVSSELVILKKDKPANFGIDIQRRRLYAPCFADNTIAVFSLKRK